MHSTYVLLVKSSSLWTFLDILHYNADAGKVSTCDFNNSVRGLSVACSHNQQYYFPMSKNVVKFSARLCLQLCMAIEERPFKLAEFDLLCSPRELRLLHEFCVSAPWATFQMDAQRLGNTVLLSAQLGKRGEEEEPKGVPYIRKFKEAVARPANQDDLSFKQIARYFLSDCWNCASGYCWFFVICSLFFLL